MKTKILTLLTFLSATVLLLAATPTITVTLSEFTLDYSGAGYVVRLTPTTAGTAARTLTDSSGVATFSEVTPGIYNLSIEGVGVQTIQITVPSSSDTLAASGLAKPPWTAPGPSAVISPNSTFRGVPYLWPSTQGAANSALLNNGSGVLSWGAALLITGTPTVGDTPIASDTTGTAAAWSNPHAVTTSWTANSAATNYVVDLSLPVLQWNMTTNLNVLHATNGTANFTASRQVGSRVKVINNSGTNFPISFPDTWKRYGTVAASSFTLTNGDWCIIDVQFIGSSTSQTNIDVSVLYKN